MTVSGDCVATLEDELMENYKWLKDQYLHLVIAMESSLVSTHYSNSSPSLFSPEANPSHQSIKVKVKVQPSKL